MTTIQQRFTDQHAIVTGGTRGIGRAISLALLAEGAFVHATYFGNDAAAERLREEAGDAGERLAFAKFDVGDHGACESFWNGLGETPISILVNNSGIRRDSILPTMSVEDWDDVIRTNLSGGAYMAKFGVQNMMRQRYGRIIFVTSPAGKQGFEGQGNYCASKAGQIGLIRALSKEVAKRKITVNAVSPGFIGTELIDDLPADLAKAYKQTVPMRRFGEPAEVASGVLYLASPEASYVTGTTLEVTGGL